MRARMGLRLGLTLRAGLFSFIALLALAATVEIAVVRPMVSREDGRLAAQAEGLAALVRREGPAGFRSQAAAWVRVPCGEWAILLGPTGAVVAGEGRAALEGLRGLADRTPAVAAGFGPWGDRVAALPAPSPEGTAYRVVTGVSLREFRADQDSLRLVLGIVSLGGLVLVGVGAWAGAGAVLNPLALLTRAAREAAAAPAERRLAVPPEGGEFEELGHLLDDLLARVQALLEEERRFASDAAHELKGPLTVLRVRAERALGSGDPAEMRAALESCTEEVDRLDRLVSALLELSRLPGTGAARGGASCDAAALLRSVLPDLEVLGSSREVKIVVEGLPEGPASVAAAPEVVESPVSVLVGNAFRYAPRGSVVEVRVSLGGGRLRVEVRDAGPGVPAEEKDLIFDRLFRGAEARESSGTGFGLGLSLARRLARSAGGEVLLLNPGEAGARFALDLPLAESR